MKLEKRFRTLNPDKIYEFSFLMFFLILTCLFIGKEALPQQRDRTEQEKAIEEYEREKLAKWKRHIGKRYLVVKTIHPVEFFRSPEELDQKFVVQQQKEGFLITEIVQNLSGTMNFYHVLFDSGMMGYLGADGNYLEVKTLDGSLIPLTPKDHKKKGASRSMESSHRAIELVKRHLIKIDPMTGGNISVESLMKEKVKRNSKLKWWYETRGISSHQVRVIQWSEGEERFYVIRIWSVDLLTQQVLAENESAKRLFQ